MPIQVCATASIMCTFGVAPGVLNVLPLNKVMTCNLPAANIMDHKPFLNIPPFGLCSAPTNPAVIAATSAALGVFTPAPCIPATTFPWVPGVLKTLIAKMPAVNNTCKLNCMWGGIISVVSPGQVTVQT